MSGLLTWTSGMCDAHSDNAYRSVIRPCMFLILFILQNITLSPRGFMPHRISAECQPGTARIGMTILHDERHSERSNRQKHSKPCTM